MSAANKSAVASANNVIIAENQQRVYDAGKQSEYDRFWDSFQQNGTRANYSFAFAGVAWTDETLQPKYLPVGIIGNEMVTSLFYNAQNITKTPSFCVADWSNVIDIFYQCTNLEEIGEIVGTFGKSISLAQSSKLKPESMIMVINRLKDYSNHANAYTYKITFHATAWANLEAHSTAPNGGTWKEYVTSKGWNYG